MSNNNTHRFDYELTTEGRIEWFSYILGDFEEYIKEYWNKTQSEDWDNVPVLPESFRVEYVKNQFEDDWETELDKRCQCGDGFYDEGYHVNCFTVKNTPENREGIESECDNYELDEDDSSLLHVSTPAEWSWMYYTQEFYSHLIKDDYSANTGIPFEDIQKEGINVTG